MVCLFQSRGAEARPIVTCSSSRWERRGSTELCCLVTATGLQGMAWGCVRGGAAES